MFRRKKKVGILELSGVIANPTKLAPYLELLNNINNDKSIGSVLINIDSPGGTVSGSDIIYNKIKKINQKKPVIAFISGTGASGAYYIACGSSLIIASSQSMIGSIGVIVIKPIIQELMNKVGVNVDIFKAGSLKDMTGMWRKSTKIEKEKFQKLVNHFYDSFVNLVSTERKITPEKTRNLATGEVFLAPEAKDLQLIDSIQSFDEAIEQAAKLGKCSTKTKQFKIQKPFIERLLGKYTNESEKISFKEVFSIITAGGFYFLPDSWSGFMDF